MLSIYPVHIFVSSVLIIQCFCSLFVFAKTSLPLYIHFVSGVMSVLI